ncbi:hypothetical protein [Roseibacillus ishigakijimensis]|uniref:Lipoprotein n=1 Tax=Roseibacillus ishigakijimensis TaxID=454146 RepID=A0A934RN06_9BACT|nr:hypothetical protein [Roseibacillus ishigakijimensis]MBK1832662.1 hypothetical protein [Roseibacillus ishigakijimensis]
MKKNTALLLAGLGTLVALSSCQDKEEAAQAAKPATKENQLERFLLAEEPPNAQPVSAIFGSEPGDEVTVTGKIMGGDLVLTPNRALLVLGDAEKITSCNLMPDDHCSTPWDVCCDDPDVIKTSIATIQAVDENGAPIKEGFRGVGGIQELTHLTVTGTVAEGSHAENLVINARGIHVGKTDEFMTKVDKP